MGFLERLAAWMRPLATWRVFVATGAGFVVFAVLLFASSAAFSIPNVEDRCGRQPPDVRVYTSGDDVNAFLDDCEQAGRDAYRNLQLADLLYPAVSGLFFASALALLLTRIAQPGSLWVAGAALPLLGAVFDYLENLAAWIALARFPDQTVAADLLGIASAAKQAINWTAGVLLLVGLGALLVQAVARRRSSAG